MCAGIGCIAPKSPLKPRANPFGASKRFSWETTPCTGAFCSLQPRFLYAHTTIHSICNPLGDTAWQCSKDKSGVSVSSCFAFSLREDRLRSLQKVTLVRNDSSAQQRWYLYPSDALPNAQTLPHATPQPTANPPPAVVDAQAPPETSLEQMITELEQDRSNLVSAHASQVAALEKDKNALQQRVTAVERDRSQDAESHAAEIAALQRQKKEDEKSLFVLDEERTNPSYRHFDEKLRQPNKKSNEKRNHRPRPTRR